MNTESKMNGAWKENFAAYLWLIWKWRSDEVYNNNETSMSTKESVAPSLICDFSAAAVNQSIAGGGIWQPRMLWVGWMKPPVGIIKLNVGGSVARELNTAGVGGILRNANGEWIAEFKVNLGDYLSEEEETWVHGLGHNL